MSSIFHLPSFFYAQNTQDTASQDPASIDTKNLDDNQIPFQREPAPNIDDIANSIFQSIWQNTATPSADIRLKEIFIKNSALTHLAQGETEKSLEVIEEIKQDVYGKELFFHKAALTYMTQGKLAKSLETIQKVTVHLHVKTQFLLQFALSCHPYGYTDHVLSAIGELAKDALAQGLLGLGLQNLYEDMLSQEDAQNAIDGFFLELAQICYGHAYHYFALNDYQNIFYTVLHLSTHPGILRAFIHLRKDALHVGGKEDKTALYTALELTQDASQAEIRKAYKKLALKYHPDKIVQMPEEVEKDFQERKVLFEEKFKLISSAYSALYTEKT